MLVQEGFVCVGVCELEQYCQQVRSELVQHVPLPYMVIITCIPVVASAIKLFVQVLRRHHPGISIHDDLRTLDLTEHAMGGRVDVVVITTPCVDVSARGHGQAQQGQVRTDARRGTPVNALDMV